MFAGTRARRQLDKQQRRAAANKRIGHEFAWYYFYETPIKVLAVLTGAGVGCWFLWTRVDHDRIAAVVGAVGIVAIAASLVWLLSTGGRRARMMRRASGKIESNMMWWIGFAGMLLLAGAIMLWRSQA